MLGAIIPGLAHLQNTIPASSHLETKDLIGMVIWFIAFIALVRVPPEKLQTFFTVCFL
jgi:NCS1 family nucleobase:cation symporter-1